MEIEVEENIKDMGQENVTKFDFNQINPRIKSREGKEREGNEVFSRIGASGSSR